MIFPAFDVAFVAMQIEMNKLERQRFDALSHEDKLLELRQREVRALERLASAKERSNDISRGHRFF
jgi:hypothetical protein